MFYDQDVNEEPEREAVSQVRAGGIMRRDCGVLMDNEGRRNPMMRFYSLLMVSARLDIEWSRRVAYYCGVFGRGPMVHIFACLLTGVALLQPRISGRGE